MLNISDFGSFLNNDRAIDHFNKLSETATKIALNNFECRFITFVIFNSAISCAEWFIKTFSKPIMVGQAPFYPRYADRTRQFIIFGTDIPNIELMLSWIQDQQFDNTGKYVVICQSQEPEECDEFEATKMFWNYKIINVIFLKSEEGGAVGYTYFPFDHNCDTSTPSRIPDVCINSVNTKCGQLFPMKLTNLNKCEVVVSTFVQVPFMDIRDGKPSGTDGDLLLIIGEGLNATLRVMTPQIGFGWGRLTENGTWSGSLSDLYNDVANFSMTSAALTLARFSHFQMSIDYNTIRIVWVTHPAELKPSSLKLLQPFKPIAQIALGISFVIVILCALFTKTSVWKSFTNKIGDPQPQTGLVFYSWMICMGLPTTKLPTKTAIMYIVMFWMWYSVLVRMFYQVCLITVLKGDYYYHEFENIDDAIVAKYPLGGGSALRDYFIDYATVYDKWVNVSTQDIVPTMLNISKGSKFVLAMNMQTILSIVQERKVAVRIIPQKIVSSPTVIFFKKYSPLAPPINRVLRRLIETGFAAKFYKNHASDGSRKAQMIRKSSRGQESINIYHYTGCYVVLMLGWIVSSVLFLAEVYVGKILKF